MARRSFAGAAAPRVRGAALLGGDDFARENLEYAATLGEVPPRETNGRRVYRIEGDGRDFCPQNVPHCRCAGCARGCRDAPELSLDRRALEPPAWWRGYYESEI